MKRKLTDAELRRLILARITKGDAFHLDRGPESYEAKQRRIADELNQLSRPQLLAKYPFATYDIHR